MIGQAAFSPDGKLLAVSGDMRIPDPHVNNVTVYYSQARIGLWDAATGRQLWSCWIHRNQHFSFSPDGKTLVVRGRESLDVLDVATGKKSRELPMPESDCHGEIAVSADGRAVALRREDGAHLLDFITGKKILQIDKLPKPSREPSLAFAPGSKLLATSGENGTIALWDLRTGKEVRRLGTPAEGAKATARFSPDGKVLAAWSDKTPLALFDVSTGKERLPAPWQRHHRQSAFSPDGRTIASWGSDGALRVWDHASNEVKRHIVVPRIKLPDRFVERVGVAFSPDGKTLASWGHAVEEDVLRMWSLADGKEIFRPRGHTRHVESLAFSPDSRVLATRGETWGDVRVWDPRTGEQVAHFPPVKWRPLSVGFSRTGMLLGAVLSDYSWKPRDCGEVGADRKPDESTIAWRQYRAPPRTDRLATWKDVRISPEAAATLPFHRTESWSLNLAFFPASHALADGEGRRSVGWQYQVEGHGGSGGSSGEERPRPLLAVSGDGRLVASAGDFLGDDPHVLRIWRTRPGKEADELIDFRSLAAPRGDYATWVALSADGRMLASVHQYKTIRVWEVLTGKERFRLDPGPEGADALAFSPDGRLLATAGCDTHTGLVWDVSGAGQAPSTPRELNRLWQELGSADAGTAFRALATLAAGGQRTAAFLKERLSLRRAEVRRLLVELDANDFSTREGASRELERLGELVEAQARGERNKTASPEARRRLDRLLGRLGDPPVTPEALRRLRALEVLERMDSPLAGEVLRGLAERTQVEVLAREARRSLTRFKDRVGAPGWSPPARAVFRSAP
jgi:WD40 repeat protein